MEETQGLPQIATMQAAYMLALQEHPNSIVGKTLHVIPAMPNQIVSFEVLDGATYASVRDDRTQHIGTGGTRAFPHQYSIVGNSLDQLIERENEVITELMLSIITELKTNHVKTNTIICDGMHLHTLQEDLVAKASVDRVIQDVGNGGISLCEMLHMAKIDRLKAHNILGNVLEMLISKSKFWGYRQIESVQELTNGCYKVTGYLIVPNIKYMYLALV